MKKIVSMLIAAVMLIATFAAAIPVAAFDGVEEVEALYFDVKPNIDGIVTEEEWGTRTTYVDQKDAATIEDSNPVNNRFFYRNPAAVPGFDTTQYSMYYDLWLRWDEDYYYVAVKVKDPDGHSLKNGRNETWNGDGFQFRLDPVGSNAAGDPTQGKPWSRKDVPDISAGFAEIAGGFTEVWDQIDNRGITPFLGGTANAEVVPAGVSYSTDSANGWTTYELAIPWNYLHSDQGHEYSNFSRRNTDGGIGKEYGMSAVVYNADGVSGSRTYNAGLGWGSGIINAQQNEYASTCGGSNSVVLSGEKVSGTPTTGTGYNPPIYTPSYPTEIDTSRLIGPLTYDNESDSTDIYGDQFFHPDGAMGGQRIQEADGNWVVNWDGDTGDLFNSPTESGLNESNYLSTRAQDEGKVTFDGQGNYTMEFDIKVTDTKIFEDGYSCTLYNWFGGSTTVDYECGYNFDTGKFNVTETATRKVLAEKKADFTLNEWHHWVFQYFKDSAEIRFYFDPKMTDGKVDPNEEPVFAFSYRYFDMPGVKTNEVILRRLNCQISIDNVKFYNFVDFSKGTIKPPEKRDDGGPVETSDTINVDYTVKQNEDGTISLVVPSVEQYKKDGVSDVYFKVDLTKAEGQLAYKGVANAPEGALEVIDNEDGTYKIVVKKLDIFKDLEDGKEVFSIVLEPTAGTVLTDEQVKEIVSVKATVTYTTGDEVIFYIAGAIVLLALVGVGVALYSKKRRTIEF